MDFNPYKCPACGSLKTFRRHGMHFDHERLCSDCREVYDPEEEYRKYLNNEENRLYWNTFKE